ncbi:hypothetical protein GCM10027294_25180 [Marinactinospora endophytica]
MGGHGIDAGIGVAGAGKSTIMAAEPTPVPEHASTHRAPAPEPGPVTALSEKQARAGHGPAAAAVEKVEQYRFWARGHPARAGATPGAGGAGRERKESR